MGNSNKKSFWRKIGGILTPLAAITGIFMFVFYIIEWFPNNQNGPRQIAIALPPCNGTIQCQEIYGEQCFFNVEGTASGLLKGDFICILLKNAGGEKWWIGGNCSKYGEDFGSNKFQSNWMVYRASVETKKNKFISKAIVTRRSYPTGQQFPKIPDNMAESMPCEWNLQMKPLKNPEIKFETVVESSFAPKDLLIILKWADNDCKIEQYHKAAEKYEQAARLVVFDPKVDLSLLEKARKSLNSNGQRACDYYKNFFHHFGDELY